MYVCMYVCMSHYRMKDYHTWLRVVSFARKIDDDYISLFILVTLAFHCQQAAKKEAHRYPNLRNV